METGPSTYRFSEFTLDVVKGCVFRSGEQIKLRPKVYEALKFLVRNPGRLIPKQELIQAVWPDTFVTDDSLVQCTLELRRALDDRDQQLLKTVPRRGYVFAAEVRPNHAADVHSGLPNFPDPEAGNLVVGGVGRKTVELPVPRTSLIGREREVADGAAFLLNPSVRLLSLTGAGGAGKTRLAIALADAVSARFASGVQFVGLASIANADLVGPAITKALGIQQVANRAIVRLIADFLSGSGPFLLVLDNFEQVLPAASLVSELLETCPLLKILITSRQCLRVYGEQEFPIFPLQEDSAAQLFVQRAAAVRPNFAVTSQNASAIREICVRLDGLPLAIELAAARTKLLSPTAILERLQSRLQLLTGGALDLPERQQTLRKTIDWSHELLNEAEQKLFRRFSVFVGGCTQEAAEAVCNTAQDLGMDLFDGLSSLVDKNLIQHVDRPDGEARFTMLETIREYGLERLQAGADQRATRRAHAAYCLVLAEEGNPELPSSEREEWLSRCELEIDNFRSSLDWLFANHEIDWGIRLCIALFRFWDMREHLIEGRARLEAVLTLAGEDWTRERAQLSVFLGALCTAQGDFPAAESFLKRSLVLYQQLEDRWGIAAALNALGVMTRDRGDHYKAQQYFESSLEHWRVLPNRIETARCLHNLANVARVLCEYSRAQSALSEATAIFDEVGDSSGAAWSINQQGDIAKERGDLKGAEEFYARALKAFRRVGDRWGTARSLADLGYVCCEQQEYEAAHSAYRDALELFSALGHRRGMARALEGAALLAAAQGKPQRALKLAAAATHLRQMISAPLPQAEQTKLDAHLASAWNALCEAEGKHAWAEGSAMSIENAIQYSLQQSQ